MEHKTPVNLSIQKEKQHIQLLKNDIEEKHKNIK